MTQEENLKQLLLKDLCARLPYGVMVNVDGYDTEKLIGIENETITTKATPTSYSDKGEYPIDIVKPYLRPMSSMTEEEFVYFMGLKGRNLSRHDIRQMMKETFNMPNFVTIVTQLYDYLHKMDWLLFKHFDVRGLISKGLAIEVNKENNPYK